MGKKFRKALLAFIDGIPDNKLEGGLPSIQKTIYEDDNYRLDMQNVSNVCGLSSSSTHTDHNT